jgi:hypothetical protein
MRLTLLQYLRGTITGYYPGDTGNRPDRKLDEAEQRQVDFQRSGYFIHDGETTRMEVTALSVTQTGRGIVGVFKDKECRFYVGTWKQEHKAFVGVNIPAAGIVEEEVEYTTENLTLWPTGAVNMECESYRDSGRPIHLSGGRPMRHATTSNASRYSWVKLWNGQKGWVQDSD